MSIFYTTSRQGAFPFISLFNPTPTNKDLYVKEIAYFRYLPQETITHNCSEFCFHYILSGRVRIKNKIVDNKTCYLHTKNNTYTIESLDNSIREEVIIDFGGYSARNFLKNLNLNPTFDIFSSEHNEKIAEIIKNALYSDYEDKNIDYTLQGVLYSIMAYHKPNEKTILKSRVNDVQEYKNKYVARASQYIEEHIGESITVNELANELSISTGYLRRVFNQTLEISPKQYIVHCKIIRASQLLVNTTLPVSKICQMAGYPDSRHFSQVFKQFTSYTISEYRKIMEDLKRNENKE